MKILHLITGLTAGGAEQMLCKLVSAMDKNHYENIVVSMMDEGSLGYAVKDSGTALYTLNMRQGRPTLKGFFQFIRILRKEKPDIVQTWMYHADLLGLLSRPFHSSIKLIWNIRCSNIDAANCSAMTRFIISGLAKLSRKPDAVIVNSRSGLQYHEALGYHPKSWRLIYNGFRLAEFRVPSPAEKAAQKTALGIDCKKLVVGMTARYSPMKGFDILIDAAGHLIHQEKQPLHFLLAGTNVTTENEHLAKQLESRKLSPYFTLLGERDDVHQILHAVDIYTSPSLYGEGFSNSIGEAMACGIPCVVTKVGDSAEIIRGGGISVAPGDSVALAAGIGHYAKADAKERSETGLCGRKEMENNYALEAITKQYESLYFEILGGAL